MVERLTVFSGGHGATEILYSLAGQPPRQVTVLVNGFDDGKSTGLVRKLIPDMWGPSDFRKVNTTALTAHGHVWASIFENRELFGSFSPEIAVAQLMTSLQGFRAEAEIQKMVQAVELFWELAEAKDSHHELGDLALGNAVLAGLFLSYGNFDQALLAYQRLTGSIELVQIVNVLAGPPLALGAISDDYIVFSEHGVVESPVPQPINRIFFHDGREASETPEGWQNRQTDSATACFSANPKLSSLAEESLSMSDFILVAPGTRHSSTLPSFTFDSNLSCSKVQEVRVLLNGTRDMDFHASESVADETRKVAAALAETPGLKSQRTVFWAAGVRHGHDWAPASVIAELNQSATPLARVTPSKTHGASSAFF